MPESSSETASIPKRALADATGWVPGADQDADGFSYLGLTVIDGEPDIRLLFLRNEEEHGLVCSGLATVRPSTFEVLLEADETIYIVEGSVRIELDTGAAVELEQGDCVELPRGVQATWIVRTPVTEFFTLTR
jgi:uncharacterized cupin superfamily protein